MNLTELKTKLNTKKKMAIYTACFLVFLALIGYFVVYPSLATILKINGIVHEQKVDLEKKYQKSQNLKKLTKNIKKIEEEADQLNKVFINSNRALEFITTMEEVADKNNVEQKINLAQDGKAKIGGNALVKTPLYTNIAGDFMDSMNYLAGVEALNYYVNVNSIEIVRGQGGKTSMNIIADTFWK